jgi:hypothetical protein
VLESGDLNVECVEYLLRVHVGKYSKPAEPTEVLRCFQRLLAIFAGLDRCHQERPARSCQQVAMDRDLLC